jgi:hypothetical protein
MLNSRNYRNRSWVQGLEVQSSEFICTRFRVQSSTVKVVKVFDFESNAEFIRALKLAEWTCTEIKSKNMKKS